MADEIKRGRVWQIVFYPESCPDQFEELIYSWHVPACLSPLHCPENNKKDLGETEGKPHYHLNLYFDGNKSYDQILDYATQLNTKRIIRVENARSMTRYLIHLDDPDKEQFSMESIISFSGVSYIDYLIQDGNSINSCENLEYIILHQRIDNMALLIQYLKKEGETELLNYIRFKNSYYISTILNGVFQANHRGLAITEDEEI